MVRKILAIMLITISGAASAQGGFFSGADLDRLLRAEERMLEGKPNDTDAVNGSMGMGYVMGVADVLNIDQICMPPDITPRQLSSMMEKYLRDHPEGWHFTAHSLISAELHTVFPCQKK